jgi:type IV secretion system protein VirB8
MKYLPVCLLVLAVSACTEHHDLAQCKGPYLALSSPPPSPVASRRLARCRASQDVAESGGSIMWPFRRRKLAAAGIEALSDQRLIEQYARVRSLAKRELHWALRSRQGLIIGFGASLTMNVGLVYALDQLTPTIRLIPMMVNVRTDGTAKAEPVMSMMPADVQDATLRATLWQYVLWREGYSADTAQFRFNIVTAMSDPDVAEAYADWYKFGNPDSPQTKYGTKGLVVVEQDSADFMEADPSVYQVNYWRTVIMPGQPKSRSHWTVFVHYRLVDAIPLKDRTTFNPGAVKVKSYPPPQEIDAPPARAKQ